MIDRFTFNNENYVMCKAPKCDYFFELTGDRNSSNKNMM